ncbi:MAG TPA: hypothetical protein VK781_14425 [Solirubrobacteraceae bacterium]|nr:hypothetical protein [Solirubrobacteraceae bacterium]
MRVKVSHQVSGPRETVPQLQTVKGIGVARDVLRRDVEIDPRSRAKAREVPTFAISPAPMVDRQPESTKQMVFIDDITRRHDDCRDRVVHDLFLRNIGDATPLTATTQLPDQLGPAPVQLLRRLIR